MKINSAQLEAFYTIAKTLNFTRAAELLNVTQSALSQRIAKLEEELEITLFIRDRTSIRLTEAGEQVLRYCQVSDAAESDLFSKLKNTKDDLAGILRIGGFSSANRSLVIPALKNMMQKNPRLSIHLMTKEIHELEGLLRSSEADYIFTNKKSTFLGVENHFLGHEENVLVRSKKSSNDEIYLDHDEIDAMTREYFSLNKISVKPSNVRYLDDVYGLIDGVKNGYGKAILPMHLIENEKDLEVLEPKRVLKVPVYLQFYSQPYYRKVHAAFLKDVSEYFKKHLRQEK
ncbi:MAG TPA: LysR family transcriptional regulator [Bdellovibrio sp.]|nr:LysR family transcriptional regulator [Bdellovibrio sp.]